MRLKTWIYTHLYKSWIPQLTSDYVSSAAYGLSYVLLWMLIMYPLYRKRIIIRV
jgi:predicted acyltransferase